jgi:PAS domain S-box-containing protein
MVTQRSTPRPAARPTGRVARPVVEPERDRLMTGVFDALDAETAVLDADGTVIAVNEAWKQFGRDNGARGTYVGINYLATCAQAHDPDADAVRIGIQAVLDGQVTSFRHDYPSGSPTTERWRRLVVNRFPGVDPPMLVVRHDSVTEERLAADGRVERAHHRLRTVADRLGDGLCTLDAEGRITYVNPHGERLLQATGIQVLGGSFVNRLAGTGAGGGYREPSEVLIGADFEGFGLTTTTEDLLIRPDGTRLAIEYLVTPLPSETSGAPDGWGVVFRDISERKRREQIVHERSEHAEWIERINDGLENDRFVLYAQPIVALATRQVVQHELLIRLRDADGGLIAPGRFLPTAEAYDLAPTIDRWVIGRAFEIAALGHAIELNLSAKSLADPSVPLLIEQQLRLTGVDPSRIVFEITETALIENNTAAYNFARRIRALGCKLALDDFGTGYSGFTYLKNLPIDLLKIDMEFVRDATLNPISQHVITAVVSLARAFGIRTVAEGVEDLETLELLASLGVDEAQGYYLGRPGPSEAMTLPEPGSGDRADRVPTPPDRHRTGSDGLGLVRALGPHRRRTDRDIVG